jgi:haloalkane dehalogenase
LRITAWSIRHRYRSPENAISSPTQILQAWKSRGSPLSVPGANTHLWREGSGEPVVCLHGVPTSAFLYRKVLTYLAARGMEGFAFDLPGMGLADRPEDFDYSWSGMAAWATDAIDAIGLDRFHLVVHDIGGPIGFDLIRRAPDRIRSLTVLNTMTYVASFQRPWIMEPLAHDGIGDLYVKMMNTPLVIPMFRMIGSHGGASDDELRVYGMLATHGDGGRSIVKVMHGFERTQAFEDRILTALRERRFPAQVVWGAQDPALKVKVYAPQACHVLGLKKWDQLHGKHLVQEDAPAGIAARVAALAAQDAG